MSTKEDVLAVLRTAEVPDIMAALDDLFYEHLCSEVRHGKGGVTFAYERWKAFQGFATHSAS